MYNTLSAIRSNLILHRPQYLARRMFFKGVLIIAENFNTYFNILVETIQSVIQTHGVYENCL